MNRRIAAVSRPALVAAALAAGAAWGADLDEEQGFRVAPGGRLEIDDAIGEVIVRGGDGEEVIASVRKTVKDAEDEDAARHLLDGIHVDIEETRGGVTLRTTAPGIVSRRGVDYSVRLEVETPRQVDLTVSVDIGRVQVESIRGRVSADADVGEIEVRDVDGAIEARARVARSTRSWRPTTAATPWCSRRTSARST